jgi:type VI secretion system protein ImpL
MQTKTLVAVLLALFLLLVGFSWWVWFATERSFSIVLPLSFTLLPPLIGLTAFVVMRLTAQKGAQKLERAIREAPRGDSGEVRQLQREFDAAVSALKRSKLGKGGGDGRDALYKLPWYVVIGPPACGKTTVLRNSGLHFPEVPGTGKRVKVKGIGGTRNCDWFLTNRAVLLDTAGRWTMEDDDHDEWLAFLDLLKKHRGSHPLNGLIAAINVDAIGAAEGEEVRELATRMRERLDEVMGQLGVSLPIYLLLTKCDLIRGFVETFGSLSRSERDKIWGFTRAMSDPLDDPAHYFERHFDVLSHALERNALRRMPAENDPSTLRYIYEFPAQFSALRDKLSSFVSVLFEDNVYQETPIMRGVYFTSGTQEGAPADLQALKLASALKIRHLLPEAPAETQPKAYFLSDMLTRVVFEDEHLATTSQVEIMRRHRRRMIWTSAAFALSALLVLPASFAYAWNSDALASTHELVRNWHGREAPPADVPVPTKKLAPLHSEVQRYERGRPSLLAGFGMYRGNELVDPLRGYYGRVLREWLVRPILAADGTRMRALQQQLQSVSEAQAGSRITVEAAQRAALLDMVQLQLLLADQRSTGVPSVAARKQWIVDRLAARWQSADPRADSALQKAAATRYVDMLTADPELAVDVDDDTVEFSRRALGGDSPTERALNALIARFESQDLNLQALIGPSSALRAAGIVPGAFTRDSWAHVYRMIENGSVWDSVGEQWVLGSLGDGETDQRVKAERGRALRAAYFERYELEWKRFLTGLSVEPPHGSARIEAVVAELARPDGPLNKLLAGVGKHVKLDDPARRPEPKPPGAAGGGADAVPPPLPAPESPDLRKLAAAFAGFSAFAGQLEPYQAQLREVLTAFTLSQQDPTQQAQLAAKVSAARSAIEIIVSSLPAEWSEVWERVLRPPLFGFGDVVAGNVRRDKEQLWCNALVRPFMDQVGGKFPLDPAGRGEASMAKLQGFLAPSGGALWQFYAQHLENQVVTRQGDRFMLEPGVEGVSYNRRLPDFLERAWKLQGVLFGDGGGAIKTSFDVRVVGASDLRQTQFSVGGKTVVYSNGPLIWQRMEWPGAEPQAGATLTIVRNDGRPNPPLRMAGEWGLFRLFTKGSIIDRDSRGRSFSVVWQPANGERVRVDFRATGASNLLLELPARPALVPPSSITAGGAGCRGGESG